MNACLAVNACFAADTGPVPAARAPGAHDNGHRRAGRFRKNAAWGTIRHLGGFHHETIKSRGTHGTGSKKRHATTTRPRTLTAAVAAVVVLTVVPSRCYAALAVAVRYGGVTLATHGRPHDRQDAQRGDDVPLVQPRTPVAADQAQLLGPRSKHTVPQKNRQASHRPGSPPCDLSRGLLRPC